MSMEDMDPSLIQDFLTESNELIEQLDADLVKLEDLEDAEQKELLNGVFRALHTIKGAASFLSMTTLTTFAHAAEDALNRLRKGDVQVNPEIMDAMLRSVDILRGMLEEVASGQDITPGPAELIDQLHAIAEKGDGAPASPQPDTPGEAQPDAPPEAATDNPLELPLQLAATKADLLEFMAADLQDASRQIGELIGDVHEASSRGESSAKLVEMTGPIRQTADFFELPALTCLVDLLAKAASAAPNSAPEILPDLLIRLEAIHHLIHEQAEALNRNVAMNWPLETFQQRVEQLVAGNPLGQEVTGRHHDNVNQVLELDGVIEPAQDPQVAADQPASTTDAASTDTAASPNQPTTANPSTGKTGDGGEAKTRGAAVGDQTVRVEVGRLEDLLNLVGQLVLNKNRIVALSRKLTEFGLPHETIEDFTGASSELDHLIGELQVGVMRTRMQPLSKLFDRYPRVIRDMARKTDKKLHLEVVGKETEVDKTVLENLADPLVHILRNSADHGIEMPDDRVENRQTGDRDDPAQRRAPGQPRPRGDHRQRQGPRP